MSINKKLKKLIHANKEFLKIEPGNEWERGYLTAIENHNCLLKKIVKEG